MFEKLKKMFNKKEKTRQDEKVREVTICDAPSIVYGLEECKKHPCILLPQIAFVSVRKLARGDLFKNEDIRDSLRSQEAAKDALKYLKENKEWCIITPRLDEEELFIDPVIKPTNNSKAVCALACKYVKDGYKVNVLTKTKEIKAILTMQCCDMINAQLIED